VSPTAPTIVTLNDQLNRAHRRIRELQSREIELLAQNRTLGAAITELTDEDARSPAELCTSPLTARSSSDVRFGVRERMRSTTKAPEHNSP
jgi:predicted transcriptional regulator